MIAASDIIQAYKNASSEEQRDFIDAVSEEWFIKMHLFEYLKPAQFEMLKRMRA